MNIQKTYGKPVVLQPSHVLRLWRERPKIFIKDVFDVKLDAWQEDVTDLYQANQRIAVIASKGPGKTFIQNLLIWHFMVTRHQSKIACLSISKDHLMSNLWAELLRSRAHSDLLKASTNEGFSKITMKGHEGYWFIDARSFPKQADETSMAATLAGLHADNVMFGIDEGGSIPDSIFATADAALSTGDSDTKCARLLVMANPESPKGILYKAAKGRTIQKWATYHISGDPDDPRRAPRVSIDWAREQIAMYGKDDPWVMVNVFGQYPPTASDSILTEEEIDQAMKRTIPDDDVKNAQHRLGVDVARGGVDRTVFARRKGLKVYPLEEHSSALKGPELAGMIALLHRDVMIERVLVDNTGGYGGSVIDSLEMFPNIDVTPVVYNARAQDRRYFNKRTENWMRMRDFVKKGGCLPNDRQLAEELMAARVSIVNGVTRLEEKEHIKTRIGRSPDRADALSQTFQDVDQASFFADYGPGNLPDRKMSYDEMVCRFQDGELRGGRQNNYISDESQLDRRYPAAPNYRS